MINEREVNRLTSVQRQRDSTGCAHFLRLLIQHRFAVDLKLKAIVARRRSQEEIGTVFLRRIDTGIAHGLRVLGARSEPAAPPVADAARRADNRRAAKIVSLEDLALEFCKVCVRRRCLPSKESRAHTKHLPCQQAIR